MFAYWHLLRMCAQPARWSVRMIATLLLAAVLTGSWQVSGWVAAEPANQAPMAHIEDSVVHTGLIPLLQLISISGRH
ncbi:hypothetical protein N9023_02650 [Opitutaceae bacterium]|nr:hypothetical protein [Opitutaceae bacterium]